MCSSSVSHANNIHELKLREKIRFYGNNFMKRKLVG